MGELLGSVLHAGDLWESGLRIFGGRETAEKNRGSGIYPSPEKEQLERYADAFYGLSKLFQKMPCQKERLGDDDLEALFGSVQERVCAGCKMAQSCWSNNYFQSCRMLYEMVTELEYDGAVSQEMEDRLRLQCGAPEMVIQVLKEEYGQARKNLMWNNRMMEQRMAAGEQIFQTAELLRHTAAGFADAPEQEQRIWKKLRRELRFLNIELNGIRVFVCEEERTEIYLSLRAGRKACVSAKTIAEVLSECCGQKMRPAWNCRAAVCAEPGSFHFVPDTKYQIFCGISKITKAGELVSGDNYAFLQKDTGKVVMSLADGMGSGAEACQESEKVIELLEQFLDAGFPQETAVRMINSCMLLQNRQQMFSTIDLCMINLYNAKCDIIKSGAVSTFIRRENEIEVIGANAFPAGVMQQSDYESMHRQLGSGSTVIMMTDGVLEALPEENREQLMVELIGRTATRNAKEYARRLMEKVYLMQKLHARDDMTILVGNIWEK
ncbi:MAG: SpoIIE family protein phosphatase [Lachnospiraceae bacterium]|nr:SpoIIE family protein phosphatase [Lachnospiraceae bacterium]